MFLGGRVAPILKITVGNIRIGTNMVETNTQLYMQMNMKVLCKLCKELCP